MKILTIIFFLFFFLPIEGGAQQKEYIYDTVEVWEIKDPTLLVKIDSFIDSEKRCEYYTPNLIIGIHIQNWEGECFITIGSDNKLGVINNNGLIYGCFVYNGHYMEVMINPDVDRSIREHLFQKTTKTKNVKRFKIKDRYDPKSGEIILIDEDDSFSFWWYKYNDGKFTLQGRHTYCD